MTYIESRTVSELLAIICGNQPFFDRGGVHKTPTGKNPEPATDFAAYNKRRIDGGNVVV